MHTTSVTSYIHQTDSQYCLSIHSHTFGNGVKEPAQMQQRLLYQKSGWMKNGWGQDIGWSKCSEIPSMPRHWRLGDRKYNWTTNNLCHILNSSLLEQHTNNRFMDLLPGLPGWAGATRNLLLEFMMQGKIAEADTSTIRLSATPSGLIRDPSCHNPPNLSWLVTGSKWAGSHTQWLS